MATAAAALSGQRWKPHWQWADMPDHILTTIPQEYTAWPGNGSISPPTNEWARCSGPYALCSLANWRVQTVGEGAGVTWLQGLALGTVCSMISAQS